MFNAGSEQLEYIFTSVIVEYAPEQYSNHSGAYILEPPGTMPLSGLKVSWASWKALAYSAFANIQAASLSYRGSW